MRFTSLALVSAAIVVGFDAIAAIASLVLQFPYSYALIGSSIIYVGAAFSASIRFGFRRGVLLGAMLGAVDATLGWAVSWAIGPGQVPPAEFNAAVWAITCATVVAIAGTFGLLGSGVGVLFRRSRAA